MVFTTCLIVITPVKCGCRGKQEINECESICYLNGAGKFICELRGAVILPNLSKIEASMPRVSLCSFAPHFQSREYFFF